MEIGAACGARIDDGEPPTEPQEGVAHRRPRHGKPLGDFVSISALAEWRSQNLHLHGVNIRRINCVEMSFI